MKRTGFTGNRLLLLLLLQSFQRHLHLFLRYPCRRFCLVLFLPSLSLLKKKAKGISSIEVLVLCFNCSFFCRDSGLVESDSVKIMRVDSMRISCSCMSNPFKNGLTSVLNCPFYRFSIVLGLLRSTRSRLLELFFAPFAEALFFLLV